MCVKIIFILISKERIGYVKIITCQKNMKEIEQKDVENREITHVASRSMCFSFAEILELRDTSSL